MATVTLVILVLLSNGAVTGTVQGFDSKRECMRTGAVLVREYSKEFDVEAIFPACVPGYRA